MDQNNGLPQPGQNGLQPWLDYATSQEPQNLPFTLANNLGQAVKQDNMTPGGFAGNLASSAGNFAGGLVNLVNPFSSQNPLNVAFTHPQNFPSYATNAVKGMGASLNNAFGQPINPQTGQIQPPNQSEVFQNAYKDPVNAAINYSLVTSLIGKMSKAGEATNGLNIQENEPNPLQKEAMSINQVNQVKLPSSLTGAPEEARMQETLNNVVPGNDLSEKYANLPATMDKLNTAIDNSLSLNKQEIPYSEVETALKNKVEPLVLNGTISSRDAVQGVQDYIDRMYQMAKSNEIPAQNVVGVKSTPEPSDITEIHPGTYVNSAPVTGGMVKVGDTLEPRPTPEGATASESNYAMENPNPTLSTYKGEPVKTATFNQAPDTIDSYALYQMKKLGNDAVKSLYGKANLTPDQEISLALRNGVDSVLTKYHPEVKDLTLTQSDLYKAADEGNLGGLRGLDKTVTAGLPLKIAGLPLSVSYSGPGAGLIRKGVAAGLNEVGGGNPSTLAGALPAISAIGEMTSNNIQNNQQVTQGNQQIPDYSKRLTNPVLNTIPTTPQDNKPDQNGNYGVASPFTIKGPDNQSLAISPQVADQQIAYLNTMKGTPQYAYNRSYQNQIDSQIATLNNKKSDSQTLINAYNTVKPANDVMTRARQELIDAHLDLLNGINGYNKLLTAYDGKYRGLATDLKWIEDHVPGATGQLLQAQNGDAARKALDGINTAFLNEYNTNLLDFTGGIQGQVSQGLQGINPLQTGQLPQTILGGLPSIPQGQNSVQGPPHPFVY